MSTYRCSIQPHYYININTFFIKGWLRIELLFEHVFFVLFCININIVYLNFFFFILILILFIIYTEFRVFRTTVDYYLRWTIFIIVSNLVSGQHIKYSIIITVYCDTLVISYYFGTQLNIILYEYETSSEQHHSNNIMGTDNISITVFVFTDKNLQDFILHCDRVKLYLRS